MSPDNTRPYKRHILLINKPFQNKFIGVVLGCVLVAVLIIAADMFTSMGRYVNDTVPDLNMAAVYQDAWVALLVKIGVYLVGVYVVSLVVSHRVAGPLYRFEKCAEEVAKGNLTLHAFLRKDDELGDFRETFNGMVDALKEKVSEDVSRAQEARRALEEAASDPGLPEVVRERLRRALAAVSAIGGRFKLS